MVNTGKKGSILDLGLIIGIALFLSIIILMGYTFMSKINSKVLSMDVMTPEAKNASVKLTNEYTTSIDNSFLVIFVLLNIGMLILAMLVRVHPIFIPIFIIALLFIILLAGILSNVYTEMASNPELIAYANDLTMTTSVMTYLPFITGIFGIVLMVVMYKSWKDANY